MAGAQLTSGLRSATPAPTSPAHAVLRMGGAPSAGRDLTALVSGKGADAMVTTILVPFDELALSERALPFATTLARTTGARLVLVRAASARPLPGMDARVAELAARRRAEAELGVLVERLRQERFSAEAAVYAGEAGQAIVAAARQWAADPGGHAT